MSIAMPTIGCPSMRQRIQPDASTSEVLLLLTGGLRPAGPPIAVARGDPVAPLRSGGARLWRAYFSHLRGLPRDIVARGDAPLAAERA